MSIDRRTHIGGHDCIKIMQGDWHELWMFHTGRAESEDLSDVLPVQLGLHTEDFNLNWFEKQSGLSVIDRQMLDYSSINDVPVRATIDGRINPTQIVDAKHTNSRSTMDTIVSRYMPQVQLYMRVLNAEGCYMPTIFGNDRWESVYVSYNESYFDSMWTLVQDYWSYVTRDEEPPHDTPATDLSIAQVPLDHMVARDANTDNQFIEDAITYVRTMNPAKDFESAKKNLKAMVADNEREVFAGISDIDKSYDFRIVRSKNRALRFSVKEMK